MNRKQIFSEIAAKAFDMQHRQHINWAANQFHIAYQEDILRFKDYELVKSQVTYIRQETLAQLDTHLQAFEANFVNKGGQLLWAESEDEVLRILDQIVEKNAVTIFSTHTELTEEINLQAYCADKKIAIHPQATAEKNCIEILKTDFLIADTGALAVRQALPSAVTPKSAKQIQVAIVGIEKVIPHLKDLALLWDVLSVNSKKQAQQIHKTIISPPKTKNQSNQSLYVILLDKQRTALLADETRRQALHCIYCDACMKICPVFRNFDTQTSAIISPIQAVKSSFSDNSEDAQKLSKASTLCGACAEICPVKIDIPQLLLRNRIAKVNANHTTRNEKLGFWFWKRTMGKRQRLEAWKANYKNFLFQKIFRKNWGKRREIPSFAPKSFHQLWAEKQKR